MNMVDLTVVNPTKDSFPIGQSLSCPADLGILGPFNPSIGSGTVTSFWSNGAAVNGTYSTVGASGNFNVNAALTSDNVHWNVNIGLTGTFAGDAVQFTATATQGPGTIVFTNVANPQQTVTLAQNNGSFLTDGKIDVQLAGLPTLYISNAS